MKHSIYAAAAVMLVCFVAPPRASADDLQGAVGLSSGWQYRRDYGGSGRGNFVPELVALGYLRLPRPRWFVRPGIRLGYSGLNQPDMPQALSMTEHDVTLGAEAALLYDAVVVPSVALGIGGVARWIDGDSSRPVAPGSADSLDRFELLPGVYGQVGVGVPIGGGALVLEPFVRYEWLAADGRARWRFGFDATVALF